jgi:hypothetical protein
MQLARAEENELGQWRYLVPVGNPVNEIFPKRDTMLTASLFQAGKGVSAASTVGASCRAADFSFFYVFPYIALTEVVMQRYRRMVEY